MKKETETLGEGGATPSPRKEYKNHGPQYTYATVLINPSQN